MRIAVIGAGGWGTALALLLDRNGHKVTLWEFDKDYVRLLLKYRVNTNYLPGVKIPDSIHITHGIQEATEEKDIIVFAIPSQHLRSVVKKIHVNSIKNTILLSVSKGIENNTLMTMSQMIKDSHPHINCSQIAVLSGPSHAEEVSRGIPTAVVAASCDIEVAKKIQDTFSDKNFRVYTTTDVLGVELGGAFKNVIAIAAGITDGAKFGDNTKAAIMTRGVAEISKLGLAMGARPETFAGLSGMGDLIVTCMSKHSRNRFVGEQVGSGKKLSEVLATMQMVAEGVETSRAASLLAQKHNVEVPITTEVFRILFEDKEPVQATYDLLSSFSGME